MVNIYVFKDQNHLYVVNVHTNRNEQSQYSTAPWLKVLRNLELGLPECAQE